ncbi:hypothetical protein KCP75_12825 [Salmonella enterica subsp. enterica]|nr:hypothetical protein KCP75_12825 [Salmonella enterica subsp. enterica]
MVEVVYGRFPSMPGRLTGRRLPLVVLIMLGGPDGGSARRSGLWSPALKTARRSSGRTMENTAFTAARNGFAYAGSLPLVYRRYRAGAIRWPIWWRRRWKRHSALTRR